MICQLASQCRRALPLGRCFDLGTCRQPARDEARKRPRSPFFSVTAGTALVAGVILGALLPAHARVLASPEFARDHAGCLECLGAPTNDVVDSGPPLGGFRSVKISLTQDLRPELLFLTVPGDGPTDAETWPLVKALAQFGSFSGLSPLPAYNCSCEPPGFEFSHASYRSRYIAFVSREIDDVNGKPFQHLNKTQLALFNRFANPHTPGPKDYFTQAGNAANNPTGSRRLPLVAVGGYLQTVSNAVYGSDFVVQGVQGINARPGTDVSFDDVQASLATGKPAPDVESFLIRNVNTEANIITALVCHADREQPAKVCGRAVIKKLLKHAK